MHDTYMIFILMIPILIYPKCSCQVISAGIKVCILCIFVQLFVYALAFRSQSYFGRILKVKSNANRIGGKSYGQDIIEVIKYLLVSLLSIDLVIFLDILFSFVIKLFRFIICGHYCIILWRLMST